MRSRHSVDAKGCLRGGLRLSGRGRAAALRRAARPEVTQARLCGCGAMYSIFTRISSGIFASRRVTVLTMTHVLRA